MILLNPKKHIRQYRDEPSRKIILDTIESFDG
jgi:hypothetical protein